MPNNRISAEMKSAFVLLVYVVIATKADLTTESDTAAACDTSYGGQTGIISSPNYPNSYNNNLNCRETINTSTKGSVAIIFKSFHTEVCCDFVTVSCPGNSSFLPQQFTGYSIPNPVSVPWCSQGLVNFRTDGSIVASGFSLNYYVSEGGCGHTVFSGSTGYVTSPYYPSSYGNNQNCYNIIWAPQRSTFYLNFKLFEVDNYCTRDWMEITCLDNSTYIPVRYCGLYTNSFRYFYGCSQLLLWFHSDASYVYKGFNILYNVYPDTGSNHSETTTSTAENSTCGVDGYSGHTGVVSSPNYPGSYYDNLYCFYYIYAPTDSTITLIFRSFNTESCCDSVKISCPSNSSFLPQEHTGHSLPNPTSIPWCSRALIHFRTDYSGVDTGFSLDYYVSEGGCGNTTYTGYTGHVTSPNYPNNYGYNQNCSNIIWAPERSTFNLKFEQLQLEFDCKRDWVEVGCFDRSAAYDPQRFCGQQSNFSLSIYGCSQLLIWFHSDGSYNYQGFNIQYIVYPEPEFTTEHTKTPTHLPPDTTMESRNVSLPGATTGGHTETAHPPPVTTMDPVCGDSYYPDSQGVIRSPNYPGYYGNYLNCDYYVYASTGSSLSFIFKSFHVEASDFVTITCPPNLNFPPHEFSGHSLPEPVSIPVCSQGRVNFHTDYTNVSSGFSIDYYVSDAGCGNTLYTGFNGFVNSPHWPEFYRYDQNCSNIIWTAQQSTIHLNFHSFNLQNNCSADWLEVSCQDNPEGGPIRYCGYNGPQELYIHKCSQVLLWFHSDESNNYQGFNIEYTIYPVDACGDTNYYGPSGVISSPNYPGNYSNFLYCDYTIYAAKGDSLVLNFESFHLQDGYDSLTISCPANLSIPKYEYTGDYVNSPYSIPGCSQGLVNFHTDRSVVSSGFSLTYYVNMGGCGNTLHYPSYGYVTSPNWPSTYGYNQNCSNIITALERSSFYLNFKFFILHSCCNCDWLEISCLDNSYYAPKRYCGSQAPFDTYIHNCSQVLLWFHSDGSSNDQGFNIEYSAYPNAGNLAFRNGVGLMNAAGNATSDKKANAAENGLTIEKLNAEENVPSMEDK